MTLSLRGNSIPTDGSGRIVITEINPDGVNDEDALICQSELSLSGNGNWFLHPTQQMTQVTDDDSDRIESIDPRGWRRNRGTVIISGSGTVRLLRLRRDDSIASGGRALEGVFTCDIPGDTNTPVSVGIYYPSECVKLFIETIIIVHEYTYMYNIILYGRICGHAMPQIFYNDCDSYLSAPFCNLYYSSQC